jgi:hypothetical protein
MDLIGRAESRFRVQHRHDDGSWATLEPRPGHHSPAEHDPERDWADGIVYACTRCDELVRIAPHEPEAGTAG